MDRKHTTLTLLAAALVLALGACNRHDDADAAASTQAPPPVDAELDGAPPEADLAEASSITSPLATDLDATAAHFSRLDLDGNGIVPADEHVHAAEAMFKAMDANGDGRVTAAEMDSAQGVVGGDARMSSADKIRAIDSNGDGILTAEEHADGSRTMFATMDLDGDGRLDLAEVRAGHDALIGDKVATASHE
jgi:Ca2+-binding EF-hand superfamily protein